MLKSTNAVVLVSGYLIICQLCVLSSIDLCFSPPDELLISSYDNNIGTNKVQSFVADDAVTARMITCEKVIMKSVNVINDQIMY